MDVMGELLLSPSGHSHVLDALRTLLADGTPRTPDELCELAIAKGLVPKGTIAKYVYNALVGCINREQLHGDKPTFVELPDGRFRLNVPLDPFASFAQPQKSDAAADAIVARLRAGDPGTPFELAVADALTFLGLAVDHDGRQGEPDVVATAPLGAKAYTVVFECKGVDSQQAGAHGAQVSDADAAEPARFRDRLRAQYAVLIGPAFSQEEELTQELQTHRVALWLAADLAALVQAHVQHPVRWSDLAPLFTAGRQSDAIADFAFKHLHGERERALVTLRYALEEGLKYQLSLSTADSLVQPQNAPLTIEALAMLVNERLAAQGDTGRVSVEDVRAAADIATHPAVALMSRDASGALFIETRIK